MSTISVDEDLQPRLSVSHLYLVLHPESSHCLPRGLKIREKCFIDTDNRIPVICEYPPFSMVIFHIHKVKWSKLLNSKLALWLEDGYLAYAISDARWQKPLEPSLSVPRFRQKPGNQDWWDLQEKWSGRCVQLLHPLSLIQEKTQLAPEVTIYVLSLLIVKRFCMLLMSSPNRTI